MNYFKYQCQSSLGKVWPLFKELKDAGKESIDGNHSEFSHTSEILSSAINGNIYMENFNLRAYECRCGMNDKNVDYKYHSKMLAIVDAEDLENGCKGKNYTIAKEVLGEDEELFMDLEESEDFQNNINWLLGVRSDFMLREGIDLVSVLKNAISGVPSAIKVLKDITDEAIKGSLYSLCESGKGRLLQELSQYV